MGLSSNARLLSITARLTSNEYESQQITNAKMRLAVQSQQASDDYLLALNQQAYSFVTYDSYGNTVNADLTPNVLFQYGDNKNQYILANANKQALVSGTDAKNFEASGTLYEFLKCYDLEPKMDEDLAALYEAVNEYILPSGRNKWEDYVLNMMYHPETMTLKDPYSEATYNASTGKHEFEKVKDESGNVAEQNVYDYWLVNKDTIQMNYINERSYYESLIYNFENGEDITRQEIDIEKASLDTEYMAFSRMVNFGAFLEYQFYNEEDCEYDDSPAGKMVKEYHEYQENLSKLNTELERRGIDINKAINYEDSTKAQWYTNLWYRMNGSSTVKSSGAKNNYQVLEKELTTSTSWIRDALTQGIVTIEQASFTNSENTIADKNNPLVMTLNGINWNSKIFSSCPDIIQKDDTEKLARAEAAYEKKTAEINAKDEKFQRQINILNTEHNALQTEYESVKSALEKNISRSFKTFNG